MSTQQPEAREFTMSQYASKDCMIGAMRERIAELESQLESSGFTAADMATAEARGFRDGVASVAASAGEPVAWLDPWTGAKATTDYDAYGKHGIPLYTVPQLAPAPSAVADLIAALEEARSAINSMKVEAETAGQGDEQMMLEACETISNEGLQADMAIRAALASAPKPSSTPQADSQPAPTYKDSTPELHVGDSAFESWYSTYNPAHKSDKQRARDAYAAGMGDPLVMAAPVAQGDAEDAARYRFLAGHCRSTSEHWGGRWSIVVEGPAPESHDSKDDFDAAIDAARSQAKEGEPQ